MSRLLLLVAAASATLLCGCGTGMVEETDGSPARAASVMVGAVEGSDAVVGLAVEGDALTFYLCGGESDFATHTHWFATTVSDDGALWAETPDGFSLEGALTEGGARGLVRTPDGAKLAWSADDIGISSVGGLYDVRDDGCRTGVVVIPGAGSTAPTIRGVWCDARGNAAQVTPIFPLQMGGFRVRTTTPVGGRELLALPVDPG